MQSEPNEQLPAIVPAIAPAAPDPERGAWLQLTFTRVVQLAMESLAAELLVPASTDSLSLADRAMLQVVRSNTPRLQAALLSKLSSIDPAQLEVILGAAASTLDELLAAAPGDPLPRHVLRLDTETREWRLEPLP